MSQTLNFVALDLGAESGRAMLAGFDGRTLRLEEVHRFPNGGVRVLDSLHWNPLRLFADIKHGLEACAQKAGRAVSGLGLDTWGVDFALLGRDDELLGNPFHYRDRRTLGMMEKAFERVPPEEIFERTGIQFMPINSLYMLLSMAGTPALEAASTFLMIPDLFNFWLSGRKACEFTDATTTQLYDQRAGDWARSVIEKLGLPRHIFLPVTQPGTVLGPLLPTVAEEVGLDSVPVIAPACHDSGSAVAAVPARNKNAAYISSGTWSIVGVEVHAPIITPQSLQFNFTNEGGVSGTVRFLKNVMGLWIVQECRRVWAQAGEELTYAELAAMAERAVPFVSLVDPDDEAFLRPGNMPARLRDFCARTGQPVPEEKGALLRCIFDSLALKYRVAIERIEAMLGRRLEVIHVVGGGSQNRLLCQLTADAAGRPVIAGPVEATAIGNAVVQAMALGHLGSLADAREVIQYSFELITYEPRPAAAWEEAYARFVKLLPG
ncbi:MAG: pentulose/hexulose kinase [Anaerolineales bacterium]|nr:pentulose/hexulose kinase [Anaerolineales bacterium]